MPLEAQTTVREVSFVSNLASLADNGDKVHGVYAAFYHNVSFSSTAVKSHFTGIVPYLFNQKVLAENNAKKVYTKKASHNFLAKANDMRGKMNLQRGKG